MKFKTLIAIFIGALIVVFSLQNAESIDVRFFLWKVTASRVLIILGSFGFGILVGILLSAKRRLINTKTY
ncbi:hypothetical protein LCGC14_0129090 [marine sediment metagenome]|uniref:Lipopolysaccharide assembly protein A domain-containing protein n=1 Tax=marine sediment metagenome TaxID=412755 RepID=A0A0F9VJX6_9ZZZZ|nr:LapA family protein [Maribacter sp.]HDZ06121.1 LapA family protein [Maribacter sp.]HEA80833.1 LapA family protein [Maribacter sp.]